MLRGPALPLFLLVLGAYAQFYQAGGWNQNSRFDLTRAIGERGSLSIDPFARNTGDISRRAGHVYCDKAPGLSFMGVPVDLAARGLGVTRPDARAYWVTLVTSAIPAAIGVVALFFLLGDLGAASPRAAAIAAAYGLGTMIFPFATLLYGHGIVCALTLVALALLVRARATGAPPSLLAGAGALLGWLVVVEYQAALVVAVLGIYALIVLPWRRVLWIAAGALPALALFVVYHRAAFGGPFTLAYSYSVFPARHAGVFMGLGVPSLDTLRAVTLSSYRGLFYSSPWLALGAIGLVPLVAAPATRALGLVAAAGALAFVLLNISIVDWFGGWGFGPRFMIPAIPFLALGAAGWPRGRLAGALLALLGLVSFAMMLVATAVKPEISDHVRTPFQTVLFPRFGAGDLAISTQSIDSAAPVDGGPRFAWNLGQLLGLTGLASLLPLVLWLTACGFWLVTRLRRHTRQ